MMLLKGFKFVLFLLIPWLKRFIILAVSSIFLMNQLASALVVQTARVVNGNPPYFSDPEAIGVNGAREYNQQNFHYFGLKFQSSTFTGMNGLNQHFRNINFPQVDPNTTTPNQLLATLKSNYGFDGFMVPFNSSNPMDTQLVTDDDGDNIADITPPDGGFKIDWFYRAANKSFLLLEADRNRTFCELARLGWNPYIRVSGSIAIVTKYGIPNFRVYSTPKSDFFIYNAIKPTVCANRPSVIYSFSYQNRDYTGDWTTLTWGEVSDPHIVDSGFVNSVSSGGFPTTGFDQARFLMFIAGVPFDLSTIASSNSSKGVNVEIKKISDTEVDSHLANTAVQVKLLGEATEANPTFSIKSNGEDIYSFTIKKWFSAPSQDFYPYNQHTSICQGNYVVPSIEDLTNSDQSLITSGGACQSDNRSDNCLAITTNHYYRRVGNNLLAEWGDVTNEENYYHHAYPGNHFPKGRLYWTSDARDSNNQYAVGSTKGAIEWQLKDNELYFVCVLK